MIEELHRYIAPHNPGQPGRIAAWIVLSALILGGVGVILALSAVIARAHEGNVRFCFYAGGKGY